MTKEECLARLNFLDINVIPTSRSEYVNTLTNKKAKSISLPRIFLGKGLGYIAELQFKSSSHNKHKSTRIKFKTYDDLIKYIQYNEIQKTT